jgi:hypothetical protein
MSFGYQVLGFGSFPARVYTIDYSVQFNGTNEEMSFTPTGAGDSAQAFSLSFWLKPTSTGQVTTFFSAGTGGANNFHFQTEWGANAYINWVDSFNGNDPLKVTNYDITTDWQHWLYKADYGNGTAADRQAIYLNGTEITTWATADVDAGAGEVSKVGQANEHNWANVVGSSDFRAMHLADAILIDGTSYGIENFYDDGPVNPSGLDFGTNGWWLDFADSGDLGKDVSGNGNDFTLANMDSSNQKTEDTPSNPA